MSEDLTTGIVRILTADDATAGTGFVVTDDGLIATCAHVVQDAGVGPGDTVRVAFHAAGEEREAQVEPAWWRGPDAEDVAILRLDGALPEGIVSLPLGNSAGAEGRFFSTFGFPKAKPVEGMPGCCEVIGHTTDAGFPVLQVRSSEVSPGFSGAPVWDDDLGVVVGMVVSITRPDAYGRMVETAFIIPVETLRDVCPALRLPVECPYRGLQVFEREHADLYFGREAATQELMAMLSQRDFVALVGVSGSGKSSLVRAGLEKGLRSHKIPGLAERLRCLAMPGRSPMFNLVLALANLPALGPKAVARAFDLPMEALTQEGEARRQAAQTLDRRSPASLAEGLRAVAPPESLLLIVDQFERLYTECPDQEVRDRLVETLLQGAGDRVKVLLALRADFYGLALLHPAVEQVVKQGGQVTLGRMNEAGLRAAIEEPARRMGRGLQPGLVERLIADVRGQAGDLPLLEFALTELWERDNQKGVLTLATYDALGYESPDGRRFSGVQGAIARRAEEVWQALDDAERQAAQRVFLGLVVTGAEVEGEREKTKDASRRAWQAEWDEATRRVAWKLVEARLLTTGRDPVSGQPTVEVSHEALIQAWPRLKRWVTDYRPFIQWYQELASFMQRWLDHNRQPDLLLPGSMLPLAQEWLRQYPIFLRGNPEDYIRRSQEHAEAERKAQERRRRRLTLATVGAAVVFLVLALLAWGQRNTAMTETIARATAQAVAEEQRRIALARQLVTEAQIALDNTATGLVRSALLGVEAMRRLPSLEADQALRRGLDLLPRPLAQMVHEGGVGAVAFSPDGRLLATGSRDGTARVWDAATGQEVTRMAHEGEVLAVAFSPDGQWLATASGDRTARVWDPTTGQEVARMAHEGYVETVAFSPDGRWLATGSWDDTARVWDPATGQEVTRLAHEGSVGAVAFSPDGRWLATGSWDGTARVWDPATGQETARMAHEGYVEAVAFSPDGRWLASGSLDGTARVWDPATGQEVACLEYEETVFSLAFSPNGQWVASGYGTKISGGMVVWEAATGQEVARMAHGGPVRAVAFSPDGRWLASGSEDGTARVWDPATGQEVARMAHEGYVEAMAFSPDGRWLASGSWGTARVWDPATGQEVARMAHEWWVEAVAFSPDGRWLATGSYDGTVRVWDPATGQETARMAHEHYVEAVAFSPDGRWLASGSLDGTARVWDPATGQEVARMAHEGYVEAVAFSPDGRWLASGSWDDTARVWDPATGQEVARMAHEGYVEAVAFSPDGQWLASGSRDGTARVWDPATGQEVERMAHEGEVRSVAFSPDGRWLATGSWGTVRVWDPATGQETARMAHEGEVWAVAFSPDGQWLATGSLDGTARVWDPATGQEVARMAHEGEGYVEAVAFSPDGRWLATGSWDDTARVWDPATGQEVARLAHEGPVSAVAFSPDGRWLATGSRDGTARVWLWRPEDLITEVCARLPRNLTREEWQMYLPDEPYHPTCPNLPVPEE